MALAIMRGLRFYDQFGANSHLYVWSVFNRHLHRIVDFHLEWQQVHIPFTDWNVRASEFDFRSAFICQLSSTRYNDNVLVIHTSFGFRERMTTVMTASIACDVTREILSSQKYSIPQWNARSILGKRNIRKKTEVFSTPHVAMML